MNDDLPEYFTAESLAEYVKVPFRTFERHLACDVGQIKKARENVKGLGIRYEGRKCRKYIALVKAGKKPKTPVTA